MHAGNKLRARCALRNVCVSTQRTVSWGSRKSGTVSEDGVPGRNRAEEIPEEIFLGPGEKTSSSPSFYVKTSANRARTFLNVSKLVRASRSGLFSAGGGIWISEPISGIAIMSFGFLPLSKSFTIISVAIEMEEVNCSDRTSLD